MSIIWTWKGRLHRKFLDESGVPRESVHDKVFIWWIILELLIFRYLWLMLQNIDLKLSCWFMLHLFIKSKCVQTFLSEITSTILLVFIFFHICFSFEHCLRNNITDDNFRKIKVYFIWRSHFALNMIMLYIDGTQPIWRTICWNRWPNVEDIVIFLSILGIIKLTITHPLPCVNELVSPRTMGNLIENKYQVTCHYLCMRYVLGCPALYFWWVCNDGIRSLVGYRKTARPNCNNAFKGMRSHFWQ